MKKNITLTLITLLTIGSAWALVHYVRMDLFSFAWALNFLLMFFVVLFTGALKSPLTAAYYDQKEWERKGKIYEYLGVNFFRKLLVWVGWEKLIRKSFPIEKNTQSLANLYYQTKKSELDHLIIFVVVLGFTIFVAFRFGILKSSSLFILNVLFNLYPIFLQRYNRPRIEKTVRLSKQR